MLACPFYPFIILIFYFGGIFRGVKMFPLIFPKKLCKWCEAFEDWFKEFCFMFIIPEPCGITTYHSQFIISSMFQLLKKIQCRVFIYCKNYYLRIVIISAP